MNIREVASQFQIFILSSDVDRGASLKVHISQVGYETILLTQESSSLISLQQSIPHIVILDIDFVKSSLSDFIEKILNISPEIQFIFLAKDSEYKTISAYRAYGLRQVIDIQSQHLQDKVLWAVDQTCESLYRVYQNEDLLDKVSKLGSEAFQAQSQKQVLLQEVGSFRGVEALVQFYRTAESKEQILNLLFDQFPKGQLIYFKYLPSVRSFVITHSVGFKVADLQGVGCQLSEPESEDLSTQVSLAVVPASLSQLLKQALSLEKVRTYPLFVEGQLEGLFISPAGVSPEEAIMLSDQLALFSLAYHHFSLEKKVEAVDTQDIVTDVFNAKYYTRKMDEEVQRARRLKQPLAVVKIAVDDFEEIEQTLGAQVRDRVLKTVATLMQKSSRSHDFVARTKTNELALVLVHCSQKGASLRADRLRRVVETSSILDHGVKLSISVGLSEFPSLCDSALELDRTSSQALMHIFEKGGNKICIYRPSREYRPEFVVSEASGET